MYKLQITEKAENDLFENALYIKDVLHSEKDANNLINSFYSAIQNLSLDPKHFTLVNNDLLKSMGIQYLFKSNFTVFSQIKETTKEIFILRFMYSRRNWGDILGKEFLTTGSS